MLHPAPPKNIQKLVFDQNFFKWRELSVELNLQKRRVIAQDQNENDYAIQSLYHYSDAQDQYHAFLKNRINDILRRVTHASGC